ncbi:ndufs4 NADH dehydrogenase Fe-S protein subunit [Coemansia sp. RSA 2399]|nr:ndufs4 NADH dehydrogenase Fe-S protein subunit [Coemansia sp. RSA 2399]KAJ1786345.1 ndufs4 NADH dehydrogenase Fe-S protein subunit [Coemansia sp. RSA 2399]KAJ1890836.1 ndufs4 NADH dehydrogenase Fe-S protein subunit [Coemansia sp. IMI 209127]KAJ1890852.1 ndufs4 NADH dehydrogenase Fe-S protein subunit [Coemansia sp. IMI 209127]
MNGILARTLPAGRQLTASAFARRMQLSTNNNNNNSNDAKPEEKSSAIVEVVHPAHEREPLPAEVISGAPRSLTKRSVRIFRPANNPMQSGRNSNMRWRIDFDSLEQGDRWSNPLMGWQSTADSVAPVRLDFSSKEDAVHFAEKQGWGYFVQDPHFRSIKPKSYKNNFVYRPGKLPFVHTK